jgi:hypothetical protein
MYLGAAAANVQLGKVPLPNAADAVLCVYGRKVETDGREQEAGSLHQGKAGGQAPEGRGPEAGQEELGRQVAVLVLLAAGLAACGGKTPRADTATDTTLAATPGTSADKGTATTGTAAPVPRSTVRIHLVSDRGTPLPGVKITFTPSSATAVTAADGTAAATLDPGHYTATVATGCNNDYFVQHTATAQLAAAPDQTTEGTLEVPAVRRVTPAKPSDFDGDGTWHVGQSHRLTFATTDRCTNKPALNASLALNAFVAGPGYRVVGTPPARTFNDGRSYVDIACTDPSADPSVIAQAVADDRDQVDLLSIDVLDRNPPNCVP